MTLSDLIVAYLEQFGVEYVFGVPGSPLCPLFDALARSARRGGPMAVLTRHEAGAAFMADGYARVSGRIGVCCSTTGPGATNLITGVASAHAEQVPLLVITPQTRIADFSRGCFQDSSPDALDIMGMFEHCTRYSSMVTHPAQLERKLAEALTCAFTRPHGPAHLSIPADIFGVEWDGNLSFGGLHGLLAAVEEPVDGAALARLEAIIGEVRSRGGRIALLVGHHGVGAGREITRFAELTEAKIATTPRGKAAIDPYHPLAAGVFGCSGHASARRALTDEGVELILAVGTNLGEWSTSKWDRRVMNSRMVHIHSDRAAFARSPMACLHVAGEIGVIFARLNDHLEKAMGGDVPALSGERERSGLPPANITVQEPELYRPAGAGHPLKAPHLLAELTRRMPKETRFFIDNSNSVPWSIHYFFHPRPEAYHLSIEFATMAWAIGAAVGSAFADSRTPTVCITGDGCYLMSGQEITVAVERELPVIFVVLNDRAYGLIRHAHRVQGKEPVDFAIPHVDFAMMARAAGAEGFTIRDAPDLERIDWERLCHTKGPVLLDVGIDPEAKPPMAMA
ncbi:MAG TPA: thiamine pyrophosphate-binding protein [Desulfuromonadaceae bacterium]